jgi:alanyl-tRNA synthetase
VPENDPSALFISAGMQPLAPYLLGEPHPAGTRLVDVQKCVRTTDIDEVGNAVHATFFEMLGNWSLGDYFKEDAIKWSYELLTSKKEGFGLDPKRLYITVFEGNADAPADNESAEIWQSLGISKNRIYFMPAEKNWWQAGENGPCGPDTEMYYDVTEKGLGEMTKEQFLAADERRDVVEIWNDVFMEYLKKDGKVVRKLPKKNVDTGAGLERLAAVLQNKNNIYETDLFLPIMEILEKVSPRGDIRTKRIVADHIRAAVFMIADGVIPSNTDHGYVLRRLIRRAVRFGKELGLVEKDYSQIIEVVAEKYQKIYSLILTNKRMVEMEFLGEVKKFNQTLEKGLKQFEKIAQSSRGDVSGRDAFTLFTTYGFPVDLTTDLAKEKGISVDTKSFEEEFKKHQALSRAGAEKKFKGGLADTSDKVIQYHTTTHLLHQALHDVLGKQVTQKGSNITAERLRFDFAHPQKMTAEEIKKVETIVNEKIKAALPVNRIVLSREEAENTGARHFFGEKYGAQVSIYYIGDNLETAYSKEFCGGPHIKNTSDLKGVFKIIKEEAVAAGVRRIKAVLE